MLRRLIWNKHTRNIILWIFAHFMPIVKGRIMCVCWGGAKYNCNPKAITDKIIEKGLIRGQKNDIGFEIIYAFVNPSQFEGILPKEIKVVDIGSFEYFYLLATSQFIIANTRFGGGIYWPFKKKNGQIFIQTQHGGHGIKKVEFDADLPDEYYKIAKEDTDRTDLMLSDSKYWTNVYRTSYRYRGEVLENGLPRNDIFFVNQKEEISEIKHYAIYTPTFRNNSRRDVYGFNVDKVIDALQVKFGGEWHIRVSSHPNMRDYYHEIYDFSHPRLIDVGEEELQPLLLSSDILITDYSSAEMDFSLTKRPIFQLCLDRKDYDRGFYIKPEDLPFPYAETEDQLIENIMNFDNDKYLKDLDKFNIDIIGLNETGHASEAVVNWMLSKF